MSKMLRAAGVLAFFASALAAGAAEQKPFAREDMASDVVRLAEDFRKETAKIGASIKGPRKPATVEGRRRRATQGRRRAAGRRRGGVPQRRSGVARLRQAGRERRRCEGRRPRPHRHARDDSRLRSLSDRQKPRPASRSARRARRSRGARRILAHRARRLPREPGSERQSRRPSRLCGPARKTRIPHRRLQD